MNWTDFQEITARLFRQHGCSAETNKHIEGARAAHDIDVWVTFNTHGISTRWVIECKYWSTNVPKEKVLALRYVVDDVGADKGILISRTGFQRGAIRAAESTNIELMTLSELRRTLSTDLPNIPFADDDQPHSRRTAPTYSLSRTAYIAQLKNPADSILSESYRSVLLDTHDQELQKAAIMGLVKIADQSAVLLLTERLIDFWGLGAISRAIIGLGQIPEQGGILALASILLLDSRTYYEKLDAIRKALVRSGSRQSSSVVQSIIDGRPSNRIHESYSIGRNAGSEMSRLKEIPDDDLCHGLDLCSFFSSIYWSDTIGIPDDIDTSIEYTQSRLPGLLAIIQQHNLRRRAV